MKFKKNIQRGIETITAGALILLMTTIESDWTPEYLIFAGVNMALFITGALLLHKYGKYEEEA